MCDVDGIVADTLPYWLQKIGDDTGIRAEVSDINQWDLAKCAPLAGSVTPDKVFGYLNAPGFNLGVPVMSGAVEGVKKLMDAGHDVYFVTARFGTNGLPETLWWVAANFPFVDVRRQVVFLKDKYRFNADVIIDDCAENLEDYWGAHAFAHCVGITYPYNARLEDKVQYRMIPYGDKAWRDIVKLVKIFSDMDYGDGYSKKDVEEIESEG